MFSPCLSQSKLLVVDDDAVNLEILVSLLGHSYDLRTAISGNVALNLIAEGFSPDLILLDIMMPDMDGYKVCQRLQADKETRHIPIIFLTALDSEEDEAKGLALGEVDYITKPFNPEIVRLRVQTHMELKQSRGHLQELVAEKIEGYQSIQRKEQEKDALLQSILMSVPVAIGFIVDRKMVWVNQKTTEMSGYSRVELEGQQTRMLYPSAEVDNQVAGVYPQIQKTGYGSFETVWRTKTGGDIDVFVNATALDRTNLSAGVILAALDVTQQKQVEAALWLNEKRFKRAQQVAKVGSWEYNLRDNTLHWSDEIYRIFGVDAKQFEATYDDFIRFIHPDDRELVNTAYQDSIHKNTPYDVVHRLLLKDGTTKYVHEKCETEFDVDGLPLVSFGTVQDITQQKTAEEALLLSESKFSRLFKLSPDAVTLSRVTDGTYIEVNKSFCKMSGWQEKEIIGRSSLNLGFWHREEDRTRVVSNLKACGKVDGLELLFQCKDGRVCSTSFSARLIEISGENCILSITRDITEQKRIEMNIIKAKEEWEATFDAMTDMVTIHDRDMRIVRANKAAHDFWGFSFGQLSGKKCCEAFWGSETTCSGCPLLITMESGKQYTEIFNYNTPDKILQVTTTPIPNGSRKPEYYVHVATDITEQRQLEKEASRANRLASLGELAAGVAHEINNPNALILYNSDILEVMIKDLLVYLEDNPPADSGQLFGGLSYQDVTQEVPILLPTIQDSAQRIKRIVNDLRDFSSQDSFDAEEIVDVNQAVQASIRLVHNAIKKTTDHFIMDLTEPLPSVVGSTGRLDQVIINLLMNACQALENRAQVLSISTAYDSENGQVQVVVADEGHGMTADVVEHILEPFVTTKREQGGTGLGISVSARIVRELHGTLNFTSAPGEGTTATISLPVRKEENHVG